MVHAVDLGHVSLPIVLSGECLAAGPRVVAPLDGAVELLLLLVTVVYMSLQMRLCTESFATCRVRTPMILAVVPLVMPA